MPSASLRIAYREKGWSGGGNSALGTNKHIPTRICRKAYAKAPILHRGGLNALLHVVKVNIPKHVIIK